MMRRMFSSRRLNATSAQYTWKHPAPVPSPTSTTQSPRSIAPRNWSTRLRQRAWNTGCNVLFTGSIAYYVIPSDVFVDTALEPYLVHADFEQTMPVKSSASLETSVSALFHLIDEDGSGEIDHAEFTAFSERMAKEQHSLHSPEVLWRILDRDGNGTVDFEEIMAIARGDLEAHRIFSNIGFWAGLTTIASRAFLCLGVRKQLFGQNVLWSFPSKETIPRALISLRSMPVWGNWIGLLAAIFASRFYIDVELSNRKHDTRAGHNELASILKTLYPNLVTSTSGLEESFERPLTNIPFTPS